MSKVAVVTDSTAYIPDEMMRGLPIYCLPLHLIWGEQMFLDNVDIHPQEFYERLQTAKVMPSTSQITPAAFEKLYAKLSEEGFEILSMHISGKLSGTLDSATQARAGLPGAKIELFDSESASMALGFQVLAVARAAVEGASMKECIEIATRARANSEVYFVVSTLEFLRRGGRIGGAQAFLGTALNLKPILFVQDGRVAALEKVRTMSKALDRLTDIVEQRIGSRTPIRLAALHANAKDEAVAFLERVRQRFDVSAVSDAIITDVSPVIGTHAGPGAVGMAFLAGM
ncbi:MAG: DegV family protein [Anaerolineaceae bacterium]|jgi:DegV family protein with EDD domain